MRNGGEGGLKGDDGVIFLIFKLHTLIDLLFELAFSPLQGERNHQIKDQIGVGDTSDHTEVVEGQRRLDLCNLLFHQLLHTV